MNQLGLTHLFDVLKMSSGFLHIGNIHRTPFGKNSDFSDIECKLLQKFGQVLSTLILKHKPNALVGGKVNPPCSESMGSIITSVWSG